VSPFGMIAERMQAWGAVVVRRENAGVHLSTCAHFTCDNAGLHSGKGQPLASRSRRAGQEYRLWVHLVVAIGDRQYGLTADANLCHGAVTERKPELAHLLVAVFNVGAADPE
jgi:hypothetical protein